MNINDFVLINGNIVFIVAVHDEHIEFLLTSPYLEYCCPDDIVFSSLRSGLLWDCFAANDLKGVLLKSEHHQVIGHADTIPTVSKGRSRLLSPLDSRWVFRLAGTETVQELSAVALTRLLV